MIVGALLHDVGKFDQRAKKDRHEKSFGQRRYLFWKPNKGQILAMSKKAKMRNSFC